MRGTVPPLATHGRIDRFIPAHAGNRYCGVAIFARTAVHPRACGEQRRPDAQKSGSTGSSPRMRGTVESASVLTGLKRFIPAHAGNRSHTSAKLKAQPVHPRACGEQWRMMAMSPYQYGSSPRMRGTGAQPVNPVAVERFIPAHAGNRGCFPARPLADAVHPRACGEQAVLR